MTRDKLLGQARELLTAGAAILTAYGYTNDQYVALWSGVVIALVSLIFGVMKHEGRQKLWSLGRKVINVGGAVAVHHGLTNPDQMAALLGILGPLLAMKGSLSANAEDDPQGNLPFGRGSFLWMLLFIPAFMTLGCSGIHFDPADTPREGDVRSPFTGTVLRATSDGGAKAVIDAQTITTGVSWLARLLGTGSSDHGDSSHTE